MSASFLEAAASRDADAPRSTPSVIDASTGRRHQLPTEVREQATSKTSVYCQGELIYDGATGQAVGPNGGRPGSAGPGGSLNEMLKWGIEHSNPEALARAAADGKSYTPSQIDKEIMDMLLGQPTVAKMRECLGKLESAALYGADGLDNGAAALEELEYYAEDVDHALDLVKIRGFATLQRCCTFGLPAEVSGSVSEDDPAALATAADDEEGCSALREAACGVLAAMLQNNPQVQRAARAAHMPAVLLRLLGGAGETEYGCKEGWEARVGGMAVVRKAMLALSALLRADPTADVAPKDAPADAPAVPDTAATIALALPRLCQLAAHKDAKLRRRTLFCLAALASHSPAAAAAAFGRAAAPGCPLPAALLDAVASDDEDTRTQAQRFLHVASQPTGDAAVATAAAALAAGMKAAGAVDMLTQRLKASSAAGGEADPEEPARLKGVVTWLLRA